MRRTIEKQYPLISKGFESEYVKLLYQLQKEAAQVLHAKAELQTRAENVGYIAGQFTDELAKFEVAKLEYMKHVQAIAYTHEQLHGKVKGSTIHQELPAILQEFAGEVPGTFEAISDAMCKATTAIQYVHSRMPAYKPPAPPP